MPKIQAPWEVWSATRLNTLLTCPLSFYFEYATDAKYKVKQNVAKVFGSAIHSMLKKFFAQKFKSEQSFTGSWSYYWLVHTLKVKYSGKLKPMDSEDVKKYLAIGKKILKTFYYENIHLRNSGTLVPITELPFRFNFKGHRLRGVMDRIQPTEDGNEEIWDYKTGWSKPSAPKLIRDIQFTFYNLYWFKKTGKNPSKMRLIHLFSGEHIPVPIRTESDYIQLGRWLDEAMIYVQNILSPQSSKWKNFSFSWLNPEDIERKSFPPRPSSFCGICEYEELCRKYQPKDSLRESWVRQELKFPAQQNQNIQLELSFPKTKRPR